MKQINAVQKLQMELMKFATFNNFDGQYISKSLESNADLWIGFVMDRSSYCFHAKKESYEKIDLIKLRDISDNYWNVDTLYILTSPEMSKKLFKLAKKWGADEIRWVEPREAAQMLGVGTTSNYILRVWWD